MRAHTVALTLTIASAVACMGVPAPVRDGPQAAGPRLAGGGPEHGMGGAARHGRGGPAPTRSWRGEDGAKLPFRSDEEIERFLRSAEVIETERIPNGVTEPLRITLEQGGTRAHAVFRYVDTLYERERLRNGVLYVNFKDSCWFEPAAYELARLLGMDNIPPVVERRIGNRRGTLQIWLYDAHTETDRIGLGLRPPSGLGWVRQIQQMLLFDFLIGNEDRNTGNILIDGDWKVWLIDHTRAFYQGVRERDLSGVAYVPRDFWRGLQALDRELLDEAIGAWVSGGRIDRLLQRRDRILDHVDGLLAERGADAVLHD